VWGDEQQRSEEIARIGVDMQRTIDAFRSAGLSLKVVSAGSTPAAEMSHLVPGITEIRPGTYVYNDLNTYYQGLCTLDDCAARAMTTVVSTCVSGQVIVDAGSKVFSSDLLSSGPRRGYGRIMEVEDATLSKLNEEHGLAEAKDYGAFSVGQVLSVIPNHVCTCINMHDEIYVARRDRWHLASCCSWQSSVSRNCRDSPDFPSQKKSMEKQFECYCSFWSRSRSAPGCRNYRRRLRPG
jgi:D-serine deaminase-like pyridoxal phosphate-dependent protein